MIRDVSIYIQTEYSKKTYKHESYDVRIWPGLEMIRDRLERVGIQVGYCAAGSVRQTKVVLVSIVSACDWYSFVKEKVTWEPGDYVVIVGGAGLNNVRPVLPFADCFVLGRGEDIVVPLVEQALRGERYHHESVVWSDEFSVETPVVIAQPKRLYPYPFECANGKVVEEGAVGCQRRCLFCAYSWHRKHIGGLQSETMGKAMFGASVTERTMFELDLDDPASWDEDGFLGIVGVDGMSERLRRMVNKPITREMLVKFLSNLSRSPRKPSHVKLYNLIGLPTESEEDWAEMIEVFSEADERSEVLTGKYKWGVEVHNSHFRPMPATPAACWPCAYGDQKYKFVEFAKKNLPPAMRARASSKFHFMDGKRALWAGITYGSDMLSAVILDQLVTRGVEDDADNILRVALSSQYWKQSETGRVATLEQYLDMPALFRAYTIDELPSRYLVGKVPWEQMDRLQAALMARYGDPSWRPAPAPSGPAPQDQRGAL